MRTKTRQHLSMLESDYNGVNVFLRFLHKIFHISGNQAIRHRLKVGREKGRKHPTVVGQHVPRWDERPKRLELDRTE
jgi:hypothetical protein